MTDIEKAFRNGTLDVFDVCKDCVKRICELIKDDEDET